MPAPPVPEIKPTPFPIVTLQGSRIEQLYYEWERLKPEFDKLKQQVDDLNDAIKAEARRLAPGKPVVYIYVPGMPRPLSVTYAPQKRFNNKRYKADHPEEYESYREQIDRWELGWA